MKDSEIVKLRFPPNCSKPLEYEKWVTLVGTTTKGLHPEIGKHWDRAIASAETSYQNYLKDVSYTRVRILPNELLARTTIEERIESRLKMMLNYVIPPTIMRQCDDRDDVTCAQILYRTMVFAGPASKEDCIQMMDILTKPRVVELNKL